jgi:hypothetical protein
MTQNQIAYQQMLIDKAEAQERARHNRATEEMGKLEHQLDRDKYRSDTILREYNAESEEEYRNYKQVESAINSFINMISLGVSLGSGFA